MHCVHTKFELTYVTVGIMPVTNIYIKIAQYIWWIIDIWRTKIKYDS